MTSPAILTTRNATLTDMVAILRTQRARRLDVVAPAAAIHAHEGNLVICCTVPLITRLPSWAWMAAAGATTSRRRARWVRRMATMSVRVALRVVRIAGLVMTEDSFI